MFLAPHEWSRTGPRSTAPLLSREHLSSYKQLYLRCAHAEPDAQARAELVQRIRAELDQASQLPCALPESPADLTSWMEANAQAVHAQYSTYLEQRKAGGPRQYFSNRAHALHFLRCVAPTKLVDGAWLYGLLAHRANPRFADLIRTYTEELGDGVAGKNHVLLYRTLLSRHDLDALDDLPDALYRQGLIQLGLGWNADAFLPEIIGFNLAYEQLPLHLLITAYELNELGLDPYYFTLHVTVDNTDTGHARRACQAVLDTLPRMDDGGDFWQRVREGSKLAEAGIGTAEVIGSFDSEREVLRILTRKATAGSGAHSDYCRVAGRSVNTWLSVPENIPGFLQALQDARWIRRGEAAANSRFWGLLQGNRAEMFGVFSGYELQVIHDWIRGDAGTGKPLTYRAALRQAGEPAASAGLLDPDLKLFNERLRYLEGDAREQFLVQAMSPVNHWTPMGLCATRLLLTPSLRDAGEHPRESRSVNRFDEVVVEAGCPG